MVELIICEKPSAAEKVAKALADGKATKKTNNNVPYYELTNGKTDIIVGCAVGHLYNLGEKEKSGWTYPIFEIEWKPAYDLSKNADYVRGYVSTLKKLAKQADTFTLACDYDVEGELIGLNALRFACKQKDGNRMKFSTLMKEDLLESYKNKAKTIDWGQANAGETRHKLDWYYGINLSRALTASIKAAASFKIMSIGRVQGPSIKMLVERENEIDAFKPVPFWQLNLHGKAKSKPLEASHKEDKFWEEKKATTIHKNINDEKNATATEVKTSMNKQPAPHPFDLTTLQTESYAHFGITPKETVGIAQKLYIAGVISYPRTSSQQLSPKLGFQKIISLLQKQELYAELCAPLLKNKNLKPNNGKKTDPAHPAIYPTGAAPKKIEEREYKIYDLIVKRFLATFGPDATRETVKLTLDVKGEPFIAHGKRTAEPGWQTFYAPYVKFKEVELPNVKEGDTINITKIDLLTKETQPPKRYTQSSIIKELEKRNLGTKATRADILDTLFKRGYAEGKQIHVTQLGMQIVKTLEKYAPDILDEELTKTFEEDMDFIREKKKESETILDGAKKILIKILDKFKKHEKEIGMELLEAVQEAREEARTLEQCQVCEKGMLKILKSRKTKKQFIACDQYPECETTYPLPQGALIKPAEKECEECTFPQVLVIRKRRRPQTLCISPTCPTKKLEQEAEKEAKKFEEGKIEKTCPDCKNPLVLRQSFYGKFLGCSTYPKCKHTESLEKKDKFPKKKAKKATKKKTVKKKTVKKKAATKKKE